ncbi:MAG: hypothetical protein ACXIUD_11890 [Mongoliitalea sp.]
MEKQRSKKYVVIKRNPDIVEGIEAFAERITELINSQHQKEFKKTVKSLKHIFESKKLVVPNDWKEVFSKWFAENYEQEYSNLSWHELQEKIADRKIILEWAEVYTKELILSVSQKAFSEKINEMPAAIRFELITLLFTENSEFVALHENQKERLLGYILGVNPRTAKGIKNGEPKYYKAEHQKRAKELLDKIKKGDIL